MAKKPNKTTAGTNVQQVKKHNQKAAQGQASSQQNQQYGAEFASETNVQDVKRQNQAAAQGQYDTEFGDETSAQNVKKQNQQSQAKKK
ncbi:MAG TPA: gamma-type small acid-soluble spore protein [Bacillota bacterium]|nr:gamma-type small acid-soluble spore protein [Bacillota bacterium]